MDDAEVTEAIEANAAELLMVMGAAGGGLQRDSGGVRWTIGGSPLDYHNAVVAADLSPETADATIAESLQLMKDRGVPGCWHVGPTMRPADLGSRLLTAGFTDGGSEPGMAVELAHLIAPAGRAPVEAAQLTAPPGHLRPPSSADPSIASAPTSPGNSATPSPLGGLQITRVLDEKGLAVWEATLGRGFGEVVKEAGWVAEVYRREG